jgi:hypothetical protein
MPNEYQDRSWYEKFKQGATLLHVTYKTSIQGVVGRFGIYHKVHADILLIDDGNSRAPLGIELGDILYVRVFNVRTLVGAMNAAHRRIEKKDFSDNSTE